MTGCTYCGTHGCEWETCPDRLEDRHGVPSDYDEGQLKTDGGLSADGTSHCPDCGGPIVTREEGIDQCRDCSKLLATDGGTCSDGTEWIGCQRCGEDKPTTVYEGGSQQADLCGECADYVDEILDAMDQARDTLTGGDRHV